jgi:hypothetical protein
LGHSINVVFVGVTGMMSDIVREILDEPDIRVTAELPLGPDVGAEVADAGAEVVILATADQMLSETVRDLLSRQPWSKVLTIRDDGRTTSLHELLPHETELGEVSPATLLEAVRTARSGCP